MLTPLVCQSSVVLVCHSVPNPFQIFEEHLLTAAIIKFRSPAVGMPGDSLSGFKGAIVF
jgi:hypothetical protein